MIEKYLSSHIEKYNYGYYSSFSDKGVIFDMEYGEFVSGYDTGVEYDNYRNFFGNYL